MALMTPEQFEASLKNLKPRVFMNGKLVDSILENRNTRTVVEANKASYEWALDPRYQHIMTCYSPLIDDEVNRYTYVSASIDDLVKKAEAGTFTAEMLGTCIYRCVGYDAFHALASTCWEIDRDLGTEYHPRFLEYLKMVQRQDLSVAGALTEPRGKRSQKTLDWPDPFLSLKVVERNKDGIVVRGAKINISGAFASHELVVLPQSAHGPGEEDYALAFATPTDAPGIIYVCQYSPYSAERDAADDLSELGNPRFGQRETSMVIFNNVFVPWERVFHCGETKYSGKFVTRFAKTHRMTCGGTCKVGFMNQIIGASKLIQEYKGLEKVAHINDQLMEMVVLRETGRACGMAAAAKGAEERPQSGRTRRSAPTKKASLLSQVYLSTRIFSPRMMMPEGSMCSRRRCSSPPLGGSSSLSWAAIWGSKPMPEMTSAGSRPLRTPMRRSLLVSSWKSNRALEVTTRQGPVPRGSPARSLAPGPSR